MKKIIVNLNDIKKNIEAGNRIFDEGVFENAVKEFVENNTDENGNFKGVLGELDRENGRFDTMLKNVSHKVTSINTDNMTAEVLILDTPMGQIAQQLVNNDNYKMTINATCEMNDDKIETINQIFTFDINGKKQNS